MNTTCLHVKSHSIKSLFLPSFHIINISLIIPFLISPQRLNNDHITSHLCIQSSSIFIQTYFHPLMSHKSEFHHINLNISYLILLDRSITSLYSFKIIQILPIITIIIIIEASMNIEHNLMQ